MSDDQPAAAGKPSVFGVQNQDELISRIDATEDDDLGSSFFGDSIADVEEAATRMFDVGIRTLTDEPAPQSQAFGVAAAAASGAGPAADQGRPSPVTVTGPLEADETARAAFILGGPAAVRRAP
jgi:hypothetical protein